MQSEANCPADNREASSHRGIGGLSGLRVLDLGRFVAAPLCAAMLADQGAEVIRIEPPTGAADRDVMPVGIDGRGSVYLQVNRNKKSLSLEFAQPAGKRILDKLIATSDVVVVSLPHKSLVKLGLDYDSLKRLNSKIILTTVSAFAYSSNERNRVGYDGMGQALSGAMYLSGTGERPMRAAVSYVDYATGASAAFATTAALLDRALTGLGQHVECSLMGTALTMMNPMLLEEATGARRRTATANRSPIAGPSDLFKAKDGWILVQVLGDVMFKRWAELVAHPELVVDPRFLTDIDRGENGEALSHIMEQWCAKRSLAECLAATEDARIPACPVLTPTEALAAWSASGYFHMMPLSGKSMSLPIATANIRTRAFSALGLKPAPLLGEDTEAILKALNVSSLEIENMRQQGIV